MRNGWFSYRWTQIFEAGDIAKEHTALKARRSGNEEPAAFAPCPVDDVVKAIREQRPEVVFAPHRGNIFWHSSS